MGHGDEIVIADNNFPAAALAQRLVRLDGHGVPEVLRAVMQFFPLDAYTREPVALMEVVPGDPAAPVIWDVYRDIIAAAEPERCHFEFVERFAFYERAKRAYAVIWKRNLCQHPAEKRLLSYQKVPKQIPCYLIFRWTLREQSADSI